MWLANRRRPVTLADQQLEMRIRHKIARTAVVMVYPNVSASSAERMNRVHELRRQGIAMCDFCLNGVHGTCEACTCVCNESDFPWPPVEDQEPKEIPV